jgi:energy-coupling factor transport system permease protein
LLWNLFFFCLLVIINPLFNQNGEEVLFYIRNLKVTKEAIWAGVDIALMILSVLFWFNLFNQIITTDKFLYLFGRIIPNTALLLSMGLRYLPLLAKQSERINQAQKALGIYEEGFFKKIKNYLKTYTALVSWSLENALDTAISMKARGYGLTKRTNFTLYRFRKTDFVFLLLVFFSAITLILFTIKAYSSLAFVITFFFGGAMLEIKENWKWHYLKSKI